MKLALIASLAVTLASCENESTKLKKAEIVSISEGVAVVRVPGHIRPHEVMICRIYYDEFKNETVAEFVGKRADGEEFTEEVRVDPDLKLNSIFCRNQT